MNRGVKLPTAQVYPFLYISCKVVWHAQASSLRNRSTGTKPTRQKNHAVKIPAWSKDLAKDIWTFSCHVKQNKTKKNPPRQRYRCKIQVPLQCLNNWIINKRRRWTLKVNFYSMSELSRQVFQRHDKTAHRDYAVFMVKRERKRTWKMTKKRV